MTISCEPVSTFDKRPFCLDNFELCNFKQVEGKQQGPVVQKVNSAIHRIVIFLKLSKHVQ